MLLRQGGVRARVSTSDLGIQGESIARATLEARGYAVLATRYRSRFGEIDIVCDDHGVVVFVEVKARRTARYGHAAEAVSPHKRRRIAAMALEFLARHRRLEAPCRFDVVAIDRIGTPEVSVHVIEGAFSVGGGW